MSYARMFVKDPGARLDYGFDWTLWLGTDTIATSAWEVPAGLVQESDSHSTTGAVVWISGGTAGTEYLIRNSITTAAGRTDERSLLIRVEKR